MEHDQLIDSRRTLAVIAMHVDSHDRLSEFVVDRSFAAYCGDPATRETLG